MSRDAKFILIIAAIIALGPVGYAAMSLLYYVVPMTETSSGNHLLYTIILIFLGLAVPYWMLKLLFYAARLRDPQETDMKLEDFPKDKDQLRQK